jgi:branched-chain amino acid transport system permease protein
MLLLQTLIDGLILGGIFSLSAVGFSLIFGVLNIVNLAHGMFVIAGAYIAFFLKASFGVDPLLSLPIVFCVLAAFGYVGQTTLIQYVIRRGTLINSLLVTFGVGLVLQNAIVLVLGPDIRTLDSRWSFSSLRLGPLVVDGARCTGLLVALVLLAFLWGTLEKSPFGKAIRATAQQEFAAGLCGVNTAAIYGLTFALSAGLAGMSGVVVGMIEPFSPTDEGIWTLNAFVVVVLGGIGSPLGALLGGLLLGLVNTLSSQYIGPESPNVFMFAVLLLTLLVRPNGVLGNAFKGSV